MAKNALLVARGHVTIALLYNAAISDWQYRNTTVASQLHIHDDLTWQFLATQVLKQQVKISAPNKFVIDVSTAMQQGVLVKKPEFINR